ncbi:MAG: pyroglutamyl-peptidase I [Sporomusaceae bacterium]|nr:pyroglutamyl-peptidase I [Sporomusaceae bacterium]
MKTILATGFEPFGGEAVNPALEAVKQLEGRVIAGHRIITRALPVVQKKSIAAIIDSIRELRPELVLAIGQAGGRPEISVERIAINVDDFRIPDNDGNQPVDEPVEAAAPAAYWSSLPVKAMVERMRRGGVPASVSNSAGTFVCNHLFYGLMHYLQQCGRPIRGGFIHIPYLPEQAARNPGQPSMGLETIVNGLTLALAAALETGQDIKLGAGKLH